jgi:amino acid adenylation domain-containing protein/non-ribosomal peptide synthase protein (TIGR01720 family)
MRDKPIAGDALLAGGQKERERDYWLAKLPEDLPNTRFFHDFPEGRGNGGQPLCRLDFHFSRSLSARLIKISNNSDIRLFLILLAGLHTLLFKYTGNSDGIVGTSIYKQENEGDFINTLLPVAARIQEAMPFKEVLLQLRKTMNEAVEHQNYPWQRLLYQLNIPLPEKDEEFPLLETGIILESIHDKNYIADINFTTLFVVRVAGDSVEGTVEYSPRRYQEETVKRAVSHFEYTLTRAIDHIDEPIANIQLLPEEERRALLETFNNTGAPYRDHLTIPSRFEEVAARQPDAIAVTFGDQALTYDCLNREANRLAHYLAEEQEVGPGAMVAVMMQRSDKLETAILAVLKAGGTYIPIDPTFPEERIRLMMGDAAVTVVVSSKTHIKTLNRLQWSCPSLRAFICLDSWDITAEEEVEKSELMDANLWEYVGERAEDEIMGGGWQSSYTGLPFSPEEMREYSDNVFHKLTPHLLKSMKVLEIGCASGITMFRIAPLVASYMGTDLSSAIIQKNREIVRERGLDNIRLACLQAHEIAECGESGFDMIIVNSVIHCFHGFNYLRKVIRRAITLLNPQGKIFFGDVLDLDLKERLTAEMIAFKEGHRDEDLRTKTDWSVELFVPRLFFEDLAAELPEVAGVEFSGKRYTIENELTKFRYDVIVSIDKTATATTPTHKHQHDRRQLDHRSTANFDDHSPFPRPQPQDPAYIIYTSGSTGTPKGTIIQHNSVINRLGWMQKNYPIGKGDTILQKTNISFDVSVWELFWWALEGAAVHFLNPGDERFPEALIQAIVCRRITTMHFIPSMLSTFLDYLESYGQTGSLHSLKQVFASGEALKPAQAAKFAERLTEGNNTRLINLYGPTEATVDVSFYNCPANEKIEKIPIGQPIDNIRLYILDSQSRLQPIGVPGELHIAGVGLSRGYLNNPQLTMETFVSLDPGDGEAILYKTGDMARWNSDGHIEFLGRIDNQVKIRGFRIELVEIESRLAAHPDIKEAVVTATQDNSGNYFLSAYYIPASNSQNPNPTALQDLPTFLGERLPQYMVPQHFIPLEEFPSTHSGKIDYKRLPAPQPVQSADKDVTAPSSEVEERLLNLWREVLGVEHIGMNDNFFNIGGDSIKAIQISARLKKHRMEVKISDLFLNPTIKRLSKYVTLEQNQASQREVHGEVQPTAIQTQFFRRHLHHRHHFNQAVMLFRPEGFDPAIAQESFEAIIRHHDALRMVFKDETAFNRPCGDPLFTFDRFDFRSEKEGETPALIETKANELQRGIDLERGPLVKLGLFHTSGGCHLLVIVHHLVIDGVSWRVLLEDFTAAYTQKQNGQKIQLPPKTTSYQEWADQLRSYAASPRIAAEVDFWKTLEEEAETGPLFSGEGGVLDSQYVVELPPQETSRLITASRFYFDASINDILVASVSAAVEKWSGEARILMSLEGHGREDLVEGADLDRTIGWFTSEFPVLLDTSRNKDFDETVDTVKRAIQQIPNKGTGYGILNYLSPDSIKQGLQCNAQPAIRFNYLGHFGQEKAAGFFTLSPISPGDLTSPHLQSPFHLEINGLLTGGEEKRLTLAIQYNRELVTADSIQSLGRHLEENLKSAGLSFSSQLDIQDSYKLAPMQMAMLFHSLMDQESGMFFEQFQLTLEGALDIPLWEQSFTWLVRRYDALRTNILHQGVKEPRQAVVKSRDNEATVHYLDLSALNPVEAEQRLIDFKREDRRRGFDLAEDILIRMAVIHMPQPRYELICSFHHIIMDGWCLGIVLHDLMHTYLALRSNSQPDLPPPTPYREYIAWLDRQSKEEGLNYWRNYLTDYNKLTGIQPLQSNSGGDNGRQGSFELGEFTLQLHRRQSETVDSIARELGVTVNAVFQALWSIMLHLHNHTGDVLFGAVVSGRPYDIEGIERMVGLFINTIPVRVKLDRDATLHRLIRSVHESSVMSRFHEYLPLADIQGVSPLKTNLLDHVLVFESFPVNRDTGDGSGAGDPGFTIRDLQFFSPVNYPFNILIIPGDTYAIRFKYNRLVHQEDYIRDIAAQWDALFHLLPEHAGTATVKDFTAAVLRRERDNTHYRTRENAPLPEHPSFSDWHNRYLANLAVKEEALEFWKERLTHQPPPLALPGDFNGADGDKAPAYARHKTVISDNLRRQVADTAAGLDCPRDYILLSAFQVTAGRLAAQKEFVCGLLGPLQQPLPVAACIDSQLDMATLIEQNKAQLDRLLDHALYPPQLAAEELGLPPLELDMVIDIPGGSGATPAANQPSAELPCHLMVTFLQEEGHTVCIFDYDSGRYSAGRIEFIINEFQKLLGDLCSRRAVPIVQLTAKKEKRKVKLGIGI